MSKWKASWTKASGQRSRATPIEDDNDVEVKRQRIGEPLVSILETSDEMMEDLVHIVHEDWKRERLTKNFSRELVEISDSSSGPKLMILSCFRVSNVNDLQKSSTRTEESIAKSRVEHIEHLLGTGGVKDWRPEWSLLSFVGR